MGQTGTASPEDLAIPPAISILGFPQELRDMIVDHLQDDDSALMALSLTCQAFRSRAQKHFHTAVFLDSSLANERWRTVNEVYSSPTLQRHVQKLCIDLGHIESVHLPALPAVVSNFRCITDLKITNSDMNHWKPEDISQIGAILAVCPTVKVLLLVNFMFNTPMELYEWLSHCSQLSALVLIQLDFPEDVVPQINNLPRNKILLPHLEQELSISTASDTPGLEHSLFEWFSHVISPKGCNDLGVFSPQVSDCSPLLEQSGSRLLRLGILFTPQDNALTLPVKKLSALEDLTCMCITEDSAIAAAEFVAGLPNSSLKKLHLQFSYHPPSSHDTAHVDSLISTLKRARIAGVALELTFLCMELNDEGQHVLGGNDRQHVEEDLRRFLQLFREQIPSVQVVTPDASA